MIQRTPTPAGLSAVSCASVETCTAVGARITGAGSDLVLAESWNGKDWVVQPTPNPSGGLLDDFLRLPSVSCPKATFCVAVGSYAVGLSSNGDVSFKAPVAELWNGTSWTIEPVAKPSRSKDTELNGVSCASSTFCIAVGTYTDRASLGNGAEGGAGQPFVERWNGSSWMIEPIRRALPDGVLEGVSCVSTRLCVAVGFRAAGKSDVPLAGVFRGSAWTIRPARNPSLGNAALLNAISCTSSTACTAVGAYGFGNMVFGSEEGLVERWNGIRWTIQPTPIPAGPPEAQLVGVSCTAASTCIAVGWNDSYSAVAEGEVGAR